MPFKRTFITGLLVLVPIGMSALVIFWLFHFLDGWAQPLTRHLFGHPIHGVGLVVTALLIYVTGLLSSNVAGRWLLQILDKVLLDLPVFKSVYATSKQLLQAFSPHGAQGTFESVVLVRHPNSGAWSLGFHTRDVKTTIKGGPPSLVAVYVPTNHLYLGETLLFEPENVRPTRLSVQEGIQAIISAGAGLPDTLSGDS